MSEARNAFKPGDRVVAKGYSRLIFEVTACPPQGLNRYHVKPLFRPKVTEAQIKNDPWVLNQLMCLLPLESEIRLATDQEVAAQVAARIGLAAGP